MISARPLTRLGWVRGLAPDVRQCVTASRARHRRSAAGRRCNSPSPTPSLPSRRPAAARAVTTASPPETMPDIGAPSRDQHFARGHDRRIPGLATGADEGSRPGSVIASPPAPPGIIGLRAQNLRRSLIPVSGGPGFRSWTETGSRCASAQWMQIRRCPRNGKRVTDCSKPLCHAHGKVQAGDPQVHSQVRRPARDAHSATRVGRCQTGYDRAYSRLLPSPRAAAGFISTHVACVGADRWNFENSFAHQAQHLPPPTAQGQGVQLRSAV